MNEILVNLGSKYQATQNIGKSFKKGDVVKACYYGHLVLEREDDTLLSYQIGTMINLIKAGKLVELQGA